MLSTALWLLDETLHPRLFENTATKDFHKIINGVNLTKYSHGIGLKRVQEAALLQIQSEYL
jgi:hypothetical protein